MASRAYDEDLYRPGSRQRPIDEAYDDQKLQQEDFSRQQTTSTIANTARNRLESSQRPINEAISNTFDKAENSSDVPPELIAQITQNVIEQLQKSIGFDGASPIQTQQSQFPPPPPPHPPPHVQHHDWPRSISPSTTASGTSSANMLERALTLPSSRSSDYAGHTSPPLPQSHAPEPKTSSLKGYKAAASSLNRPSSPISRTSNASDGHGDRSSRPRGTTRLHTGMEKTVLEKIWGPLFDEDGRPTLRLSQFLRGLAIEDYEPRYSLIITPEKMVKYYDEVKLDNELYPWSIVFDENLSAISRMYQDLSCQHHLVQERNDGRPDIPGLTPVGFEQWVTILIQAHPEAESERLAKAVLHMPIYNPDDRKERFPKVISKRLFPKHGDLYIRSRIENAMIEHASIDIPWPRWRIQEDLKPNQESPTDKLTVKSSMPPPGHRPDISFAEPEIIPVPKDPYVAPRIELVRAPCSTVPEPAFVDKIYPPESSNIKSMERERKPYLSHAGPPKSLSEALETRDLHTVQRFLAKNSVSAANSDYAWLHELDEAGYSTSEIAELLLEDVSDFPWIYFTPRLHIKRRIRKDFHVAGCAHQRSLKKKPPSLLDSERVHSYSPALHTDVRRLVEELCGIGGVVPSSRDVSAWHGSVTFEEQASVSVITYAAHSAVAQRLRSHLVVRISNVLANFCTAVAAVQSTGLCCDSFTVLLHKPDCLELRRLEFRHALAMSCEIDHARENYNSEEAVHQCAQSAEYILRELKMPFPGMAPNAQLHYCALAAQFLCSAFLSYIQAHIGPIDPFFLDRPQRKMVLLGSQHAPGELTINAELVELTCLAEMTQQPVFAFSLGVKFVELCLENGVSRYDVLTNAEDCLDTWGPGYFVHNKARPSMIHAVAIAGGFISLIDTKNSRFHWTKGKLWESASQAAFDMHTIMKIGAAVSINKKCYIDEAVYRKSSFSALEPLGTQEVFWEAQERQAGFQGGQYLIGTYSQTWKKVRGITLKQRTLQQADWCLVYFLEQKWGLQVSFCTSVARRVSLRELVTDLLPMFVNPLEQETWQALLNDHDIIRVFERENLFTWLLTLSPFLQRYVLTLVRTILEQLQHTGLDSRKTTLVIAWPQEGDIGRGLKVPCRAETCWAQIIADAEDCATFAYVTPRCLETNHIKCRGNLKAWQNASKMLVTEISPSGLEGQPLVVTNAANNTPVAAPVTTAATTTTPWELEDQKTYYIKKIDSLLRVKVERPSSASNDVTHLVVATSSIPQTYWKRVLLRGEGRRNNRIRERQATGDRAELVVVRTCLVGALNGG